MTTKAGAGSNDRKWSIYVIKLNAAELFKRGRCLSPDTKCLYVGQTSLSPAERFIKHKGGGRTASRVVRDFGCRLAMGYTRGIGPFDTEQESLRWERRLANRLKARSGYKIWGGQGKGVMGHRPRGKRAATSKQ